MTTAVQRRRGTNTEHATFTGLDGEITVNTTTYTLHVHDGATVGGVALAKADGSNLVTSSIDINGGTIDGTVIGGSSAAAGSFTTISASGEIAANGGVAFGDNDKATFGASDDLQIYHDGTHSYIDDVGGTGNLKIRATNLVLQSAIDENYATFVANGAASLFYDNAEKLATTATGIDVTGTVTADGLTVNAGVADLTATFQSTDQFADLKLTDSGGSSYIRQSNGSLLLQADRDNASASSIVQVSVDGTQTARFSSGGDISFYEDTGTTAKFFWDASAESLELGTSASMTPTASLAINEVVGGTPAIEIIPTTDATSNITASIRLWGTVYGTANRHSEICNITDGSTASNELAFKTNGSERMRIDSAGNVGIGTSSPDSKLDVSRGSSGEIARFTSPNGTNSYITIGRDGSTSEGFTAGYNSSNGDCTLTAIAATHPIIFKQSTTERMRIDSSGNLLVGTTSATMATTSTETGTQIVDGSVNVSANNPVAQFNRITSDGAIVNFRKDGTTVGSIGSLGGTDLLIGSGASGLRFRDAVVDNIQPYNTNGTSADGNIDLGAASERFKDLYLSGGVYLGGTGAANKLDDYEEGTWTPDGSGAGNLSGTGLAYAGTYTKIGNTVICHLRVTTTGDDLEVTSYQLFTGLPFSVSKTGTGTAITEDIDQFSRQGYAAIGGSSFALSKCGSSTGTTAVDAIVVYMTS